MTNARVMLALAIVLSIYIGQQVYHLTWAAEHHVKMQLCLSTGETEANCELKAK